MPRLVTAIFILCLAAVGGALGSSDIFSKIALNAGTLDPNTIPSLQIASENESSVIFNQVLTSVTFTPRVVTTVSDHVATPHTTVRLYLVALAKDVSYQTLTNVISEHNIINYIPDRAYLLRANIREISNLQKISGVWINLYPDSLKPDPRIAEDLRLLETAVSMPTLATPPSDFATFHELIANTKPSFNHRIFKDTAKKIDQLNQADMADAAESSSASSVRRGLEVLSTVVIDAESAFQARNLLQHSLGEKLYKAFNVLHKTAKDNLANAFAFRSSALADSVAADDEAAAIRSKVWDEYLALASQPAGMYDFATPLAASATRPGVTRRSQAVENDIAMTMTPTPSTGTQNGAAPVHTTIVTALVSPLFALPNTGFALTSRHLTPPTSSLSSMDDFGPNGEKADETLDNHVRDLVRLVDTAVTRALGASTMASSADLDQRDLLRAAAALSGKSIASIFSSTSHSPNGPAKETVTALYEHSLLAAATRLLQAQVSNVVSSTQAVIASAASLPSVLRLELSPIYVITNNRARYVGLTGQDPIPLGQFSTGLNDNKNGFHLRGIDGRGQIVGMSDTGFDYRSCNFASGTDPIPFTGVPRSNINQVTDATHRKLVAYYPFADDKDYEGGHGTHCAGSVLADPSWDDPSPVQNATAGVAYGAKMAFFDIGVGSSLSVPADLNIIHSAVYTKGAKISSHSWGCNHNFDQYPNDRCNQYSTRSVAQDRYAKENPDYLILFAAGNNGRYGLGTLGEPATSKNILTIGALTMSRNGIMTMPERETTAAERREEKAVVDDVNNNDNALYRIGNAADFTSLGPANDGRIKPDVGMVGQYLFSAKSSDGYLSGGHQPTCQGIAMQGTSMATPVTAGFMTLLRQYLQQGMHSEGLPSERNAIANPTSALMKAITINSGQDQDYVQIVGVDQHVSMRYRPFDADMVEGVVNLQLGNALLSSVSATASTRRYFKFAPSSPTRGAGEDVKLAALFYALTTCPDTSTLTLTLTVGYPNPTQPPIVATTTPAQGEIYVHLENVKIGEVILAELTADGPACNTALIGFEFDAPNEEALQGQNRFYATCQDTFESLPPYSLIAGFGAPTGLTVVCPPVSECMPSADDPVRVWGTSRYYLGSRMCEAAMHSGAIDVTMSGPQAFTYFAAKAPGIGYRYVGSTRYGITSGDNRHTADSPTLYAYRLFKGAVAKPHVDLMPLPKAPNNVIGFGRVQLNAVLPVGQVADTAVASRRRLVILSDGSKELVSDGVTQSYRTQCFQLSHLKEISADGDGVSIGQERTKVTLVYTDYAGASSAAKSLVSDLDLHVFGPSGEEWRGNERIDRLNNVEQAWIRGRAQGGLYCATVRAWDTPLGKQSYSLIATGRGALPCGSATGDQSFSGQWRVTHNACGADVFGATDPAATYSIIQAGDCLSFRLFDFPTTATAGAVSFKGLRRSTDESNDAFFPALGQSFSGRLHSNGFTLRNVNDQGTTINLIGRTISRSQMAGEEYIPDFATRFIKLEHYSCTVFLAQVKATPDVQDPQ